ncbi:MAG: M20/M25/M40 family metallo-hydrolase [Sumerlaeia bacterium]
MNDASLSFLKRLLDVPSPSGFEEPAQAIWSDEVRQFVPDIRRGVHGDVYAVLPGRGAGLSVALMGHADEIGLIVRFISEDGLLYVAGIGGVDVTLLPGERVRFQGLKGEVHGVVGSLAIHLKTAEQRKKSANDWNGIWVDLGAKSREEALTLVAVGTPGVFGGGGFQELPNGRAIARCWDNRIGCFIVAEVLRRLAKDGESEVLPTVFGISTAQEEICGRGAQTILHGINPHFALVYDVTHATDTPDCDKRRHGDIRLGAGGAITVGVLTNNALTAAVQACAKRHGIPLQTEADNGKSSTDADQVSIVRAGIPVAVMGCPLRYMHTASEIAQLSDIDALIDVTVAFLKDLTEGFPLFAEQG